MDEKKFDALCKAVNSIEQILWIVTRVVDSNGISDKDGTNINLARRNYHYYMGIAEGNSTEQTDTE